MGEVPGIDPACRSPADQIRLLALITDAAIPVRRPAPGPALPSL